MQNDLNSRWQEGLGLLREVAKKRRVIGFDVVEVAPTPDSTLSQYTLAKLVYKFIAAINDSDARPSPAGSRG